MVRILLRRGRRRDVSSTGGSNKKGFKYLGKSACCNMKIIFTARFARDTKDAEERDDKSVSRFTFQVSCALLGRKKHSENQSVTF